MQWCAAILTREKGKGKKERTRCSATLFASIGSRARDSRQNRRKSRESKNALSFCLVDLRNCLETKHHGTSLSGLLAEFFSSRSRSHFIVPTARTSRRRSNRDRSYIFLVLRLATLARRDIRTLVAKRFTKIRTRNTREIRVPRELPRVASLSFSSKLKEDEGTSGHGHIRDTIALEFRRDNRHAVSSRYR